MDSPIHRIPGKEYTPEQKRPVTEDVWRIETRVANMEWADQVILFTGL